jgi:hypothetical protein
MTITHGYATLDEVKNSKRITSTNATDDAYIEDLVEAASRWIDRETGRRFWSTVSSSTDETRTYTPCNGDRVYIDDLLEITTLKTDDDSDRTYETTWASTDYDLLPENALLEGRPYTYIECAPLGDYTFPKHRKAVQVVGKFGFSDTPPDDIKQACIMIVATMYNSRYGAGTEGAATITGAGVVITPKDIPAGAKLLVQHYRRLS